MCLTLSLYQHFGLTQKSEMKRFYFRPVIRSLWRGHGGTQYLFNDLDTLQRLLTARSALVRLGLSQFSSLISSSTAISWPARKTARALQCTVISCPFTIMSYSSPSGRSTRLSYWMVYLSLPPYDPSCNTRRYSECIEKCRLDRDPS